MDTETSKIYQNYQALPEDEQRVLQVLSVIFEPRKKGALEEVLTTLEWQNENGELLANLVDKEHIDKWETLELVTYNKYQLQCSLLVIDHLTYETVKNGTLDEIVPEVRKVFPIEKPFDMYRRMARPHYVEAQLRIATFQHDNGLIQSLLRKKSIDENDKKNAIANITQRFAEVGDELFENLPAEIKFVGLANPLRQSLYQPKKNIQAIQNAELHLPDMAKTHVESACLLAELYLFQGRLDEAITLLTPFDHAETLAMRAWLTFLQSQGDDAVTLFHQVLEKKKEGTRKRNVHIEGLVGVFHIIALLSSDTKTNREIALKQLALFKKSESKGYFKFTLLQLKETLEIQQGELDINFEYYLKYTHHTQQTLHHILQTLQWLWLGTSVSTHRRDELIHDYQRSHELGLNWLTWQIGKMLEKIQEKSPSDKIVNALDAIQPEEFACNDLCDAIKKREDWEIALEALKDVRGISSVDAAQAQAENTTRMSWRIAIHPISGDISIEPREQKLSKNGKWTAGRKVALKKLYEDRDKYDYLTDHDQKICNHIHEHNFIFRGYPRSDYEIDSDRALLTAIGHPLIFMEENLKAPIELHKEEPRLDIKETSNGKSLRLQLIPYGTSKTAIQKISDQKLVVVEYQTQHQKIADIVGKKGIVIPIKAKQQVMDRISQLAPILTIHTDIAGADTGIDTVEAQRNLHFHIQPIDDGLKFSSYIRPFDTEQPLFRAGEGGAIVFTEIDNKPVQAQRSLKAEKAKLNKVLRHCPALYTNSQQEWYLDDPELALETLLQLQEREDEVQLDWPQGKKITLNNAAELSQMSLSIRKSKDWFSVSGELTVDNDQVLEMRALMDLLSQSKGRFIRLGEQQFLTLTEELRERLDAIQAYTSNDGKFHTLAIPAIDELSDGMQVKASKPWKDQLARLQDSRSLHFLPPTTLQAELRDYQLEGFQWLSRLAFWGAGACLADDMGLGKTIQALALILTRCKEGATLVIAPTSVCNNWETEAYRFAPTLNIKRFGQGNRQKMLDDAGAFDLVICSYGLLQSESEKLTQVHWNTVVADEAQAIKNHQAKRTKAAMQLQADFRIITTGTPIENHLGELWSLFNFINPGLLGSLDKFNTNYASPIERDNDAQTRVLLKNLISPFILRRLKSDVLTELPPRTEITLKIALSNDERALYEATRQQAMENVADTESPEQRRMKILAEIMRLRRTCCNPRLVMPDSTISSSKLEAFAEIVDDLRENHHKALVFSQFVGHLDLVREYLDRQQIDYQYLDGSTPAKKRQQAVNDFQAGEGDLFMISLKAGGSGLNLTAADYVIHLDPWWNPAVEDQASDRAHRMGQQRPVTIYRLVAENTIEEKIVSLHHQKRDLADSLLEGTEMSSKLSVDDILALLREN